MRKILIVLMLVAGCTEDPELQLVADAGAVHHPHPDAAPDASPPGPDAAPPPCGELNEACCTEGQRCNGGAHADIYCSTGGVCLAPVPDCGGAGQACCNPLCEPGGACITWPCEANGECQAGTCMLVTSPPGCGGEGEACCVHPGTSITFCDQGFDCDGEAPDGTRTCL